MEYLEPEDILEISPSDVEKNETSELHKSSARRNIKKALEAKKRYQESQFEIVDDEEEPVKPKRGRGRGRGKANQSESYDKGIMEQMADLKSIVYQLALAEEKKKRVPRKPRKTVVQIQQQPAPSVPSLQQVSIVEQPESKEKSEQINHLAKKILNF